MFFHPNDGTHAYPDSSDCNYQPLWERINDLQDYIETLTIRNEELNETVQRYSSTFDTNVIRVESVISQDVMDGIGPPNAFERYQRDNEQTLMRYLCDNNYFVHEVFNDYSGDTRIRTSLRILDNPN
jgi:hypothetical protein